MVQGCKLIVRKKLVELPEPTYYEEGSGTSVYECGQSEIKSALCKSVNLQIFKTVDLQIKLINIIIKAESLISKSTICRFTDLQI